MLLLCEIFYLKTLIAINVIFVYIRISFRQQANPLLDRLL